MKSLIFLIALLACHLLSAQSLGLQQLGSLGGEIGSGNNPLLVQSMGAVAATVIQNNDLQLDQGMFLSCDLTCSGIKTGIETSIYDRPLLSLYPNPTHSVVNLKGESIHIYRYKLYGANGQQVAADLIDQQQISLENLPAGLYMLHVYGRSGHVSMISKVVKR